MNTNGVASNVVPSQFNPKPTSTPAPAPATTTATPAPTPAVETKATPSEVEQLRSKLQDAERREGLEKKTRITEKRQWEREKQTFGEKLKSADEYAKLRREASVNPISAAKALWGDKWHEHLNTVQANGGAPTAESVALEIQHAEERAAEKFRSEQAEAQKTQQEASNRRAQAQIQAFSNSALEYVKGNEKKLVAKVFGTPERAANAIVQRIRQEHDNSVVADPETGDVITPGKVLSFAEAADAIEKDMYGIAEQLAEHEEWAPKLRERLTPATKVNTVPPASQSSQSLPQSTNSQGRRSLTNDMTGNSTQRESPKYATDADRLAGSIAKYHEEKERLERWRNGQK